MKKPLTVNSMTVCQAVDQTQNGAEEIVPSKICLKNADIS